VDRSIRNLLAEPAISKKLGVAVDSLSLVSLSQCKSCPSSDVVSPAVPYDRQEAERLDVLLPRIAEYREKLGALREELRPVAHELSRTHGMMHVHEVEGLIFRTFYRELEDRPHQTMDIGAARASVRTEGVIRNRNPPCEVCGENRRTDKCHIIPNALGGTTSDGNILTLCPSHHALLDAHMLSEEEWQRIAWPRKCEVSQVWAEKVTHVGHRKFWERQRPTSPGTALFGGDHQAFARELAGRVVALIGSTEGISQRNLYQRFDQNVRVYLRTVLKALVKVGVVDRRPSGSTHLLSLAKPPEESSRMIADLRFRF
jgi:hypothetical protein